ncbi:MAG: GtrA family protein [Azonexaceae bacterium]|nr:GtrA family protein [Azonexaceae bacterium]
MSQFVRFCLVGGVGFFIDAGILQLLVALADINPYTARVFSFIFAASGTWIMNRRFTFQVRHRANHAEWLRYIGLMVIGAIANYGVFVICVKLDLFPISFLWLAVAIGSIAGLGVNYTSSKLVFRSVVH